MNDNNPTPSPDSSPSPEAGSAQPPNSLPTGHCRLEPLCSAVHHGTQRAKAAAEQALPKIKSAVAGATYWLGFGAAFASVFSYTLAKELAPERFKAGCREGTKAGRRTAENLASQACSPGETSPPEEHSSAATPQPGSA